jgi:hypothetical protein
MLPPAPPQPRMPARRCSPAGCMGGGARGLSFARGAQQGNQKRRRGSRSAGRPARMHAGLPGRRTTTWRAASLRGVWPGCGVVGCSVRRSGAPPGRRRTDSQLPVRAVNMRLCETVLPPPARPLRAFRGLHGASCIRYSSTRTATSPNRPTRTKQPEGTKVGAHFRPTKGCETFRCAFHNMNPLHITLKHKTGRRDLRVAEVHPNAPQLHLVHRCTALYG